MTILFEVTAPVFLLIGAGALLVTAGVFGDKQIQGIMNYSQGFAIPCLLFFAIYRMNLVNSLQPQYLISFYIGSVICFFSGLLGCRYLFRRDWEDSIVVGFTALFGNTVLLGLSIIERAYSGLTLEATFALVSLHAPFCYFLGITAMEVVRADSPNAMLTMRKVGRAIFSNALMRGILLGFAFNVLGLPLPNVLIDTLEMISASGLPAALFALGGVIVRYRPKGDVRLILFICVISLGLHPIVTWLFSSTLYDLHIDLVRSAVITSAMAPGVNAYIFSSLYGRSEQVVASSVLIATGLSILTASAWLYVLAG